MDYNQKDGYPYPPSAPTNPGYPSYPPGDMPQPVAYQQPQPPPPGYAYPPVPVPVSAGGPILTQPHGGFYPIIPPEGYPPHSGGGYPQPQHFGSGGGYPQPPQGYPQPPIQMQPTQGGYGSGTTVPLNVPSGLEYLTQLDRLFVKQKVELLEAFLRCETKNKYKIKDSNGQDLYTAKEDTDCCTRNCCGPYRPFDIKIKDSSEREVIHLSRPFAFDSCWCPCWLQTLEVFSPPGQLCGTVEQEWSICSPKFVVKNSSGDVVLRIEGPVCTFSICGDVEFQILSRDGATQVGKISKRWSGLVREAFTDADNFGINFPMDLDVRMKAVMLGACFLIDFMFFEKSRNKEYDSPGMF